MKGLRLATATLLAATAALFSAAAWPQANPVRIGMIDDESSVYSGLGGKGSVLGAQMAIEDFGGKVLGRPIEFRWADHQNQPDLGISLASAWLDKENFDVLLGGGSSAVLLAVQSLMKAKPHQMLMITGASSMDFAGKACTKNSLHFTTNNYMLLAPTVKAMTARGDKDWYLLSSDNAGGIIALSTATKMITDAGGSVIGTARFPLESTDFSSFLFQAQSSGGKVLGLGTSGSPLITIIKQASEFGLTKSGIKLALLAGYITDINTIGLQEAQGLLLSSFFYWDHDASSRAWSKRFFDKNGTMPTQMHAAAYSAVFHYLRAVDAAKTSDAEKVMPVMKAMRVHDRLLEDGYVREDGAVVRPVYSIQVKSPSESHYPWDYYKILETIPGDQAYMSMKDQGCPLVNVK